MKFFNYFSYPREEQDVIHHCIDIIFVNVVNQSLWSAPDNYKMSSHFSGCFACSTMFWVEEISLPYNPSDTQAKTLYYFVYYFVLIAIIFWERLHNCISCVSRLVGLLTNLWCEYGPVVYHNALLYDLDIGHGLSSHCRFKVRNGS